ncbi:MAG: sensor histidine kinase [Planctomycetota bacterium]
MDRPPPPSAAPSSCRDRERPPHVLVVDDKGVVRDFLREVLELNGYRVSTAPNGDAALDLARHDPPQVVLTDLAMEPMPGRDLVVQLKRECPSAVAVVLTGHGTVERAVDLMRLGAFDVLTKPCRAEEIAATIAKALEHHEALQTNLDLRERLRVQDKLAMIGKLAAGVAHELNNPLDAALRCIRLTQERVDGDEESREYLDLAARGLQRMADIVQSLLTFSRNAALEQSPQALGELVSEAMASVRLALGDGAPAMRCDMHVSVARVPQPRGLHQVLTNLIRNACDASGSTSEVTIRALPADEGVLLEIADQGPGIPAEIRHRVFEPFFTTKAPGRGTGLGLPLSARLVEKFGGRIDIHCPVEGGTVVEVHLPAVHTTPHPVAEGW